jgi:phosphoribosyl-AMP cyclohydrolase
MRVDEAGDDVDCDDDTVVVKARPTGNLCGHGFPGCFIQRATPA